MKKENERDKRQRDEYFYVKNYKFGRILGVRIQIFYNIKNVCGL